MTARPEQSATARGGGAGRRQPTAGMARSGGDLTMGPNATRAALPEKTTDGKGE
jgi:hypothetical protein